MASRRVVGTIILAIFVVLLVILFRGSLPSGRTLEAVSVGIDGARDSLAKLHGLVVFRFQGGDHLEVDGGVMVTHVAEEALHSHPQQVATRLVNHPFKLRRRALKPLRSSLKKAR